MVLFDLDWCTEYHDSMSLNTPQQSMNAWHADLARRLERAGQRTMLILRGDQDWCIQQQFAITESAGSCLLSNRNDFPGMEPTPFSKAENLLGLQFKYVIYDLYSGLNTDVLSIAAGLVKAGGLLVLTGPKNWTEIDDPYAVWQGQQDHKSRFLSYCERQLGALTEVVQLEQNRSAPVVADLPVAKQVTISNGLTREQAEIMLKLMEWSGDMTKPAFLLTAARGRGKSTLLGRFVTTASRSGACVVTGPSKTQVSVLMQQSADAVEFMAPDEIIRTGHVLDMLVLDEAAMIPLGMLDQLMQHCHKFLLATTTGGYEGTGQGFLLKWMARLPPDSYHHETLKHPVRWGRGDLLEPMVNAMLMLDSTYSNQRVSAEDIQIGLLDQTELLDDSRLLNEVYGLLVSAHYRTRPSDLRQLLDDPNLRILVAAASETVVGVLVLNCEGGLEQALCDEIFMGRRRPQGHLLAQMLTAQAGIKGFCQHTGMRIMRVAVADQLRRRGIGSRLIDAAIALASEQKVDYIGSSFAIDASVLPFWRKAGFAAVHVGAGLGTSSGRMTIAVIRGLSEPVAGDIVELRRQWLANLPLWLLTQGYRAADRELMALLNMAESEVSYSTIEKQQLIAFSEGHRGLELSQPLLQRFLISEWNRLGDVEELQRQLLMEKIILNRNWNEIIVFPAKTGRKALINRIRLLVLPLVQQAQYDT